MAGKPTSVLDYHERTKHPRHSNDRRGLVDFQPMDPTNRPSPFKRYPDREPAPLPANLEPRSLQHLLFYAAGVTRRSGDAFFRTAMSAGNLHPLELYVLNEQGVHHFAPDVFGLAPLRARRALPLTIVVTGIPWRTAWKYGERGFRHLYWDAGTMLANLLALGDDARVHVDFDDDAVACLVGVDGVSEFPLAVVTIGHDELPVAAPDDSPIEASPLSPAPIEFPLITDTQRSGIGMRVGVASIRGRRIDGVEEVILRRGSTRLFTREAVGLDILIEALTWASEGLALVEHYIAVHAVDGLPAGTYRWNGDAVAPLRAGDVREVTEALCLHQPLGGDAAFTVFHCADLTTLNPRSYRAAQLEAGIASGRLALAAFAHGAGATGLTFFDDQVAAFFRTEAACMLVTAVGVPAYRNTAGSAQPGRPIELRGYERVMVRLAQRLDEAR
jgi:hypothetical protein